MQSATQACAPTSHRYTCEEKQTDKNPVHSTGSTAQHAPCSHYARVAAEKKEMQGLAASTTALGSAVCGGYGWPAVHLQEPDPVSLPGFQ